MMGRLVIVIFVAIVALVSSDGDPHDTQYQTNYFYDPTAGRNGYDYQRYQYPGNYYNSDPYSGFDYNTYPTSDSPSYPPTEPPRYPPYDPPSYPPNDPPSYPPRQPPSYPPHVPPSYPPSQPPSYPPHVPPSYPPSQPPSYPPHVPPSYPPSQPPSYPPHVPHSYPPSEPSDSSYETHGYRNPCHGSENEGIRFPVAGVCFAFFECHGEESLYRHCDDNYRFDFVEGECVYDEYCYTACPVYIRGNPANDHTFYLGNSLMNCAYGTYFDYKICACQHNYLRPRRPYMPYNPEDES